RHDGLETLLDVPRTTVVRIAQARHDGEQLVYVRHRASSACACAWTRRVREPAMSCQWLCLHPDRDCMPAIFRSLRGFNFRLWAAGAFVSNIGTWMQRTAQDWLVFAELTDRNATAVGIVMALQFGPPLLLLPLTGL